ncbi:LysM domain-containing protein [Raineyella antarctica]|uniref:LysM domain-containing protein n=1 Tax=Raineyella antarctica TaxID=1577474 RepID=A0A1G6HS57_9ACTN|nr:LysM peptidoglycan-binding domain-containing protein [Raineyella antarctica]SDB96978.1 LysM domain-containing protein [Raineyella antarctica]
MRVVRGLLALAALLASLLVVPWLLLAVGHYPDPSELTWDLLRTPDDGRVLLWAVTALGWVVWVLFTVSTALDLAALQGRPAVRLPGLRWMQGVSGALLVAVLVMLGSNEDHPGTDGLPPAPMVVAAHAAPVHPVQPGPQVQPVAAMSARVAETEAAPAATSTLLEYTVVRGDDLWTLAETYLGDGMQWRQILDLNRERLAGNPEHLEPGWVLQIPVPAAASPTEGPAPTVKPDAEPQVQPEVPPVPEALPVPAAPAPGAPAPASLSDIPISTPASSEAEASDTVAPDPSLLLGGTGALVATGITAMLAARRQRQLVQRPLGQLPERPTDPTVRLRGALLSTPLPPAVELVEWAVHMVARDALRRGRLAGLDWLRAGPDGIEFHWDDNPAGRPPAPFTRTPDSWSVGLAEVAADRRERIEEDVLRLWPTLVSIGTRGEDTYFVDLERWGRVSVQADTARRAGEVLTSYVMELATNPWAGGARVLVVGDDGGFVDVGEAENVVRVATLEEILPAWESTAATQQALAAVADEPVPLLRLDPDYAEAWAPQVLVLLADITPAERSRLTARFDRTPRGPLVLLSEHPGADATLLVDEEPLRGTFEPVDLDLTPQLVPRSVRDAVVELARVSAPDALVPAPWWAPNTDQTAPEELTMADDPRLLLLGPVVLEGARGVPPTRAPRQCLEYCAWLLEHPNASSVEMARSLLVAEATRRSNMSRLRGWLGASADGAAYLPEAYSGRIRLHPAVRSDWQEVQILLGRGVEMASDATLVAILELVRGAPLADAPPGGWTWAEELRIEAACALRDVAYVLSARALEGSDPDLAKWAIGRGLVAAPGDEALQRQLLVCESRSGNVREVERLVYRLNAQARSLGVDLLPETVTTMQEVLEGGIRAREATGPARAAG